MAACRSSLGDLSPRRRILRPRGCYYNPCRNHSRFLLIEARYLDLLSKGEKVVDKLKTGDPVTQDQEEGMVFLCGALFHCKSDR
jgi:hypothetical protein